MPKVSVIMPSLNVGPYIRECLESVVNQTLKNIEILCVDAGSTDGTEDVIREYAARDARVSFIHSDIRSYGYQVNLGLRRAQGEYVAVLETDDFVAPDMYEYLYELAVANDTDITKADFDRFTTMTTGAKVFTTQRLFDKAPEYYNRVIRPREVDILFVYDFFLWKGIYKRQFILDHDIRLNESPGAAFQDMGFMNQVLSFADRAIYSDRSLYRYRVDRDEASTYSPKVLGYGMGEFKWLMERFDEGRALYERGMYIHMLNSFWGELYSALQAVDCDYDSPYIAEAYDWYWDKLSSAIDRGIIEPVTDSVDGHGEQVMMGRKQQLEEVEQILEYKRKKQERTRKLTKDFPDRAFIIFGAGRRGQGYIRELDGAVKLLALTDNSSNLWGSDIYGYEVLSPTDCVSRYPEAVYLIANKDHGTQIEAQLTAAGVTKEHILVNYLSDNN